MTPALRQRVRTLRGPAIVLGAYLALRAIFDVLTVDDGLITPSESPSLGVAALGAVVLALRLGVLTVLPAVVVFRLLRPR